MRHLILFFSLFAFLNTHGQRELPSTSIQKLNRSKDSLQLTVERKNSLSSIRTSARNEGINILLLAKTARSTKDQDALYIGNLEKKDVYRVNTSALVSKYANETEKNLEKLFANAVAKQCVLFFDNADALFSKSTQPESIANYIENLARGKKVLTIFWCEEDCLKWLRNSKYVAGQ